MKLFIMLGAPGSGKGTQCALLSSRLGFRHISTGSIIRKEIQKKSAIGLKVKEIVESGNLVDDKIIFECLEKAFEEINSTQDTSILLDGIPRNLSQANDLQNLIKRMSFEKVIVICLNAEVKHLLQRFQSRFTCSSCNHIESIQSEHDVKNIASYTCPSCKKTGSMTRRLDDEINTVHHRLDLYQKETSPLIAYYQEKNILHFVDGLLPPEFVYAKVASCLI